MKTTGGRLSLRLVEARAEHVLYAGALGGAGEARELRVRVELSDGRVTIEPVDVAREPWVDKHVRATLRAAWRSSRTGVPWPRRLSRWRPGGDDAEGEGGA